MKQPPDCEQTRVTQSNKPSVKDSVNTESASIRIVQESSAGPLCPRFPRARSGEPVLAATMEGSRLSIIGAASANQNVTIKCIHGQFHATRSREVWENVPRFLSSFCGKGPQERRDRTAVGETDENRSQIVKRVRQISLEDQEYPAGARPWNEAEGQSASWITLTIC